MPLSYTPDGLALLLRGGGVIKKNGTRDWFAGAVSCSTVVAHESVSAAPPLYLPVVIRREP
jgi:hypothetical protein